MDDDRELIKLMAGRAIKRRDLEGTRFGRVQYDSTGTNPYGKNLAPVQLEGDAERLDVIVPVIYQPHIKNDLGVWCKRNQRGKWKIHELDDEGNASSSSGVGGASFAGGKTQVRTPVGAGGSGGGDSRTGVRYGGTGADLSVAADGLAYKLGSVFITHKHNLTAITDPTTGDNAADGYGVGSLWYNTLTNALFIYIKEAAGVADWDELTISYPVALENGGTNADLSTAADGFVIKDGSNLAAIGFIVSTSAPTITDDDTAGFGVFSLWHHYDPGGGGEDDLYVCLSAATGAARWEKYALQDRSATFDTSLRVDGTLTSFVASGDQFSASGALATMHKSDNTDYPIIELLRSRASVANPQNNDILGAFRARGYNASGTYADLRIVASENHSGTNRGVKIEIYTIKNGTNTPAKHATIEDTGRLALTPDSSAAPINLSPAAEPSTLTNGDVWIDDAHRKMSQRGNLKIADRGTFFTQTADVTVSVATNGTTDTTLVGSGVGTNTLPANYLKVGTTIKVTAAGDYTRASGTNGYLRLFLGAVQIGDSLLMFDSTAATAIGWRAEWIFTVRSIGSGGTVVANVTGWRNNQAKTETINDVGYPQSTYAANTTGSLAVAPFCRWSNTGFTGVCTCRILTIERLN